MTKRNPKFWEIKICQQCGDVFECPKRFKNQRFCSSKCSSVNKALDPTVQLKRQKTNLERYGCICPSQNKNIVEKAKKTCLDKYGVDNASKTNKVKSKIKRTNKKRYGVEHSWQIEAVKEKIKQTNLDRYGVENGSSCKEIRDKVKATNLERYGVDNPSKLESVKQLISDKQKELIEEKGDEILDKRKKTNLERFGVENPMYREDLKQKNIASQLIYWSDPKNREAQRLRQVENLKKRQYGSVTDIEQIIMDELDRLGIVYEFQYEINGFLYDFWLVGTNTIVEVNGDYWHCNPSVYKEPINEIQVDSIKHDITKNDVAKKNGYDMIILWEGDIKNDLSMCMDKILVVL